MARDCKSRRAGVERDALAIGHHGGCRGADDFLFGPLMSLANVELLTLQIRLLVCSIDKAEQIGLNWWRYDTNLTTRAERAEAENLELRERLSELELEIRKLSAAAAVSSSEPVITKRVTTRKITKKRRG